MLPILFSTLSASEICQDVDAYAQQVEMQLNNLNDYQLCATVKVPNTFFLFYKYEGVTISLYETNRPGKIIISEDHPQAAYRFFQPGKVVFDSAKKDATIVFVAGIFPDYPEADLLCDRVWMSNLNGDTLEISPKMSDINYRPSAGEYICAYFAAQKPLVYNMKMENGIDSSVIAITNITEDDPFSYMSMKITGDRQYTINSTIGNPEFTFFVMRVGQTLPTIRIGVSKSKLNPTKQFRGFYGEDSLPPEYIPTPTKKEGSIVASVLMILFLILLAVAVAVIGWMMYNKHKSRPKYLPVQDVEYELKDGLSQDNGF